MPNRTDLLKCTEQASVQSHRGDPALGHKPHSPLRKESVQPKVEMSVRRKCEYTRLGRNSTRGGVDLGSGRDGPLIVKLRGGARCANLPSGMCATNEQRALSALPPQRAATARTVRFVAAAVRPLSSLSRSVCPVRQQCPTYRPSPGPPRKRRRPLVRPRSSCLPLPTAPDVLTRATWRGRMDAGAGGRRGPGFPRPGPPSSSYSAGQACSSTGPGYRATQIVELECLR